MLLLPIYLHIYISGHDGIYIAYIYIYIYIYTFNIHLTKIEEDTGEKEK